MTIAEKITRAKTDYDEVYEAGKQEIISLHPEKTVSGSFISVDDVSELPHDVKCKISGVDNPESVTVTRTGKNMLKPLAKTVNSKGITYTVDEYGVITASGTIINESTVYSYTRVYPVSDYITGEVTVSGLTATEMHITVVIAIRKSSGTIQYYYLTDENGKTFQCEAGDKIEYVELRIEESVGTIVENFVFKPQLEFGRIATEYETYNEQIFTPSADGTVEGMTSVSPCMTIFTDNADAMLDVTYRQSTGIQVGKQAEYDAFWGAYQSNGQPKPYTNAFGSMWTTELFKPKYDICPTSGYMMFYNNIGKAIVIDDFVEFCKERGIVFDLSRCTTLMYGLGQLKTKRHGVLDFSSCKSALYMFYANNTVETIEEMIFSEINDFSNNSTFADATKLANINKVSGILAKSIHFQNCPLTKNSITNIVNVLSPTVTGQTVTFNKAAKEAAFTNDEWAALIATKPNWTFSLV